MKKERSKPNRKSFILLLKSYCRIYSVVPVLKNIKTCKPNKDKRRIIYLIYLPSSTIDSSHNVSQFKEDVSLHPTDCRYQDFRRYSETGENNIPTDWESRDLEKRTKAAEFVRKCFKDVNETSNSNIIWNANDLLTTLKHDRNDITCVGSTKQRVDAGKFKFNY